MLQVGGPRLSSLSHRMISPGNVSFPTAKRRREAAAPHTRVGPGTFLSPPNFPWSILGGSISGDRQIAYGPHFISMKGFGWSWIRELGGG